MMMMSPSASDAGPVTTEPIPRRKLHQEVLDRLIARIRSGEFPPGAQLPSERELMDAYGVGRPSIREALQQLERSGIIGISHGERSRVLLPTAEGVVAQLTEPARFLLSVDPDALEHLKEARILLEAGVARLAAQRADAAGLAALRQRLDEHRAAGPDDFLSRDIAFHRQIAVMSGNPVFPAAVEAMLTWLGTSHVTLVRAPGAEHLTLEEHARICEAIADRDPDAAGQAMSDHLARADARYHGIMEG